MAYTPQTWANGKAGGTPVTAEALTRLENGVRDAAATADTALTAAQASAPSGGGTGSTALVGGVALDSFTGTTDDAKLTAALSYVAAQTVKPPIIFANRQYSFSQAGRTVFSGMKLAGPYAHGNQQRAANSIPNDIRFSGSGVWWQLASGSVFDVGLYGLSFQGNSGAQFMAGGSSVLWTSVFRDLGFNLWGNVLGTPAAKLLMTANLFDGWWNVNNGYGTAFTLGGSDCNLWTDGMLLDSQPSFMPAGQYHLIASYLQKTTIGPLFITCDQRSGILVQGGANGGPLVFCGQGRAEGRNDTTPCYGSNVRIDGGNNTFRDWWISYGATNLSGSGHTGEGGVITVTGGQTLFSGVTYDRASGVAETVPFIYQSGGYARVRDVFTAARSQTWSTFPGKPRVQTVGGVLDADNSVTVS